MLEPYHAIVYFAPESREAYADLGLKGFWMGYFASRAGAMGPVPAEVVVATFFNFHPRMVHKAIPDAWHLAAVEDILATRRQVAANALRRVLGDDLDSDDVAEAAILARRAAEAADPVGRALFAGHAALAWPESLSSCCGTRRRSSVSSAATGTSPPSSARAWTASAPT
jgi:hypothetical protein